MKGINWLSVTMVVAIIMLVMMITIIGKGAATFEDVLPSPSSWLCPGCLCLDGSDVGRRRAIWQVMPCTTTTTILPPYMEY